VGAGGIVGEFRPDLSAVEDEELMRSAVMLRQLFKELLL
jgi:hypothetical protein